jgi:hypothetical protein
MIGIPEKKKKDHFSETIPQARQPIFRMKAKGRDRPRNHTLK